MALDVAKDFCSVTAGGVGGTVAGRAVMVGKPDFLRNEKVAGLEPLEASAVKLQEEGKTAMFVAIDGRPAGVLAVADPIKATAEAIKELHALGFKLVMLTGDFGRCRNTPAGYRVESTRGRLGATRIRCSDSGGGRAGRLTKNAAGRELPGEFGPPPGHSFGPGGAGGRRGVLP